MGNNSLDGATYVIDGVTYVYRSSLDGRWFGPQWPFGDGRGSEADLREALMSNSVAPNYFQKQMPAVVKTPDDPVKEKEKDQDLSLDQKGSQDEEKNTSGTGKATFVDDKKYENTASQQASTAPDSRISGTGNTSYVITPTVESSQELTNTSDVKQNVAPVITSDASAQLQSQQAVNIANQGPSVTVSPVLTVDMADTYVVTTESTSAVTPTQPSWLMVGAIAAAGIGGVVLLRKKTKKGGKT